MIKVKVDGSDWTQDLAAARTMSELIELVKASIDPDNIITSITINGTDPVESDWRVALTVQGDSTVEISTGSKGSYINERLGTAVLITEQLINEFTRARSLYQEGISKDGNTAFGRSVNDLKVFLEWYYSVLALVPGAQSAREEFRTRVSEVTSICEQLFQQQLYQSWWALGQTIQNQLEPKLGSLRDYCANFAQSSESGNQSGGSVQ